MKLLSRYEKKDIFIIHEAVFHPCSVTIQSLMKACRNHDAHAILRNISGIVIDVRHLTFDISDEIDLVILEHHCSWMRAQLLRRERAAASSADGTSRHLRSSG